MYHHHNNHNHPGTTNGMGISLGSPPGLDATTTISALDNMDRHGLAVRTEGRDRLAPLALGPTTNGRRSRATSPVRHH
ncbi:hypothetical protein ACJ73_08575 [Blastomyces percursus]|uniref:Uncharacterized protein n=1 Tax=Blastomyces percursus TaxID=1658174 RepID=A0A1J9QIR4_9EURO|nr:hypothetical protein ACJ73_08575 [Blastomyces percursus]